MTGSTRRAGIAAIQRAEFMKRVTRPSVVTSEVTIGTRLLSARADSEVDILLDEGQRFLYRQFVIEHLTNARRH